MSSRNFVSMQQKYNRVIVLVDMDCFFCQVEEKLDPQLKGQPLAVVQYNAWRGGGIIAVNYAARAKGVTRHMRGDEAKERCPEIQLVKVPNIREKADLGKYREAGKEVANVLQRFTPLLERASVDEAYLDITEAVNKRLGDMNAGSFLLQPEGLTNTYAVGYEGIGDYVNVITNRFNDPNSEDIDLESSTFAQSHDAVEMAAVRQSDIRLLIGAAIAGEVRAAVKADTGYECSAGIAHNKILAKLACGINKPNKQTILPLGHIPQLFQTLPLGKIRGLGGKFGEDICTSLKIQFLGELLPYTEHDLQRKFDEKSGTWLYYICRGIDLEAVTPRFYSKSIGCCKKFPGRNNITGLNTLRHWLGELANEVCDRIEKDMIENNRRAKQMVVSFVQEFDGEEVSSSRSAPLGGYDQDTLTKCSLEVIQSHTKQFFKTGSALVLNNPIKFLGISVGKFETVQSGQGKLQEMFASLAAKKKNEADNKLTQELSVDNGSISKDTQVVEVPAVKKSTFMQNFLRNGCNAGSSNATILKSNSTLTLDICENKPPNAENVASDLTVIGTIQQPESSNSDIIVTTQATEKRSFFLNALKKQNTNESQRELTTFGDAIADVNNSITQEQTKSSDISKSFFAKLLRSSNDETNRPKLAVEENFESSTLQSCDNDIDESAETMQQTQSETGALPGTNEYACDLIETSSSSRNKRKYTALQDNSMPPFQLDSKEATATSQPISTASYEASYAEFAVPELREEFLQMIKCEICKANVPSDLRSMQLHQDRHVAMQLSQQLRDEYRTEVKTQLTANKPATTTTTTTAAPSKKPKKSPVQSTKSAGGKSSKNGTSIMKFLKPPTLGGATDSEPTAEVINLVDDTVDMILCNECNSHVAGFELQAHKDFHVAKTLQRQLNMLEVRTVSVAKKTNTSCNSTLNATQSSVKNIKPITQFFSQSNC